MPTAWRIVKARHAARAFDGAGAHDHAGRWNSPGTPMVYTSDSAALATMEMLVHLDDTSILPAYVLISCRFDSKLITRFDAAKLPPSWRAYPAPAELQPIGDDWVRSGRSGVLQVPSAMVPQESNFLLNPRHADFERIEIGTPERFELDLRLLRSR